MSKNIEKGISYPPQAEKYTKVFMKKSDIMINNFIGGISWGVGSVIGATIVISLIFYILYQSTDLPIIGDLIQSILDLINKILEQGAPPSA